MEWKPLDLHLLVILEAVARERGAAEAAARLKISQSAVRHAIGRLRQQLNDPLLIETPDGSEPTPYCLQIIEPTRAALRKLTVALDRMSALVPKPQRKVEVAVDERSALIFGARLALVIAEQFPDVDLHIRSALELDVTTGLERGDVDLSIGTLRAPNEKFTDQTLISSSPVAIVRRGHPIGSNGTATIEALVCHPHIDIVSYIDASEVVDIELARLGVSRRIALHLPFVSAVRVLMQSNMIAIIDHASARSVSDFGMLDIVSLPFSAPKLPIYMLWHCESGSLSDHRWLRTIAMDISRATIP